MWRAQLAWVQDEERMSYTLLNILSLGNVIHLGPNAVPTFDSTIAVLLPKQENAEETVMLSSFSL